MTTQGTWKIWDRGSGDLFHVFSEQGDGQWVPVCEYVHWDDAKLIAAAPKLKEALEAIERLWTPIGISTGRHAGALMHASKLAREALKEATE